MITSWENRTAVVTGGASGIGLAMARAFAVRGMRVMLLDVEAAALDAAVDSLAGAGANVQVQGLVCDVTRRTELERAAAETAEAFGPVHLLCPNAGVGGGGGPAHDLAEGDWRWTLGVNLVGVVQTVEAFVPGMLAHGEEAHVLHTASMAGMLSPPGMAPYSVSKFGVVALAEAMAQELSGTRVGVSVLCPGFVVTRIHESARNRPAELTPDREESDVGKMAAQFVLAGIPAERVAERVVEGLEAGEPYIFTHPEMRGAVEARFGAILAGFDSAARSPALQGLAPTPFPTR